MNTTTVITAKPSYDFNGDGHSDILYQNDSGQAEIWLMNGPVISVQSLGGPNPGTAWHAIGGGDFNGDGKADILWQNDTGQAAAEKCGFSDSCDTVGDCVLV